MVAFPPRIVAIETSGARGSVAAGFGPLPLAEQSLATSCRHAADLMPVIDRLWRGCGGRPADLAECYISAGPGSFTGLRVAVTVARHLALALGTRLVAVPSLHVIAEEARPLLAEGEHLAVLLDAKREQVFAATYVRRRDDMVHVAGPVMTSPAVFLAQLPRPARVTGEGMAYHAAAVAASGLPAVAEEHRWPRASAVYRLGAAAARRGEYVSPTALTPLYVRRPEAEELWEQRHGSGAQETTGL